MNASQPVVLYDYWRSSASYRVRIALHTLEIGFETVPVDLLAQAHKAPEYLGINPQGRVPTLEIDGLVYLQSGRRCGAPGCRSSSARVWTPSKSC